MKVRNNILDTSLGLVIQGDAALWERKQCPFDHNGFGKGGTAPAGIRLKWWGASRRLQISALASRKRDGTFIQSKETRCL